MMNALMKLSGLTKLSNLKKANDMAVNKKINSFENNLKKLFVNFKNTTPDVTKL